MMNSDSVEVADIGIALPIPNRTRSDQIFGKRKTFAGLLMIEWTFLVVSLVNITICLALTVYRLVIVSECDMKHSPDFTLTILIIINCLFCVFYVLHGVLREKEYEIYVYIGAILFILVYCILEYVINVLGRSPVKLGRLITVCVAAPFNIILAVFVAREFGWLEFKIMGASEALQNMYRDASRYTSLLMFDLQVMITFVLLVLNNGMDVARPEIITLSVAVPLSIMWCCLGWQAMRRESRCAMIMFLVLGLASPAYVSYVVYELYIVVSARVKPTELQNVLLYGSLAAASLSLIMCGLVYIEAWRVFKNFGKGLKERAFEVEANERTSLLAVPRRR